jgi:hypothetical protein
MATVYGQIIYGTHIYGNTPTAVRIIVDGADMSSHVLRGMVINDSVDRIKTSTFEVK